MPVAAGAQAAAPAAPAAVGVQAVVRAVIVDGKSATQTEINAGGIVLGSRGTQYAVQLRRTNEGTVCDGVVFHDELEVTVPAREAMKLASNSGWTPGRPVRRRPRSSWGSSSSS